MTRNNFYYLKATVKDLQSAILKNSQSNIDLCYGILLGVRSCGLKIDSFICSNLIDIFVLGNDNFIS